jgi:hypothetical protein
MGEVVNVIVAFAVIVILFRWATSSKFFLLIPITDFQRTFVSLLHFLLFVYGYRQ